MAGSKNGFVKVAMVGGRVGTTEKNPLRYTPCHTKPDGSIVSARLEIPVFVNEYGSKEGKPDAYKVVAWGGRADMFAKSLSQGKEMNFDLKPSSYFRKVYNNANQIVMQPDGSGPIMVRALSFAVRDFTWGADAEKQVSLEVNAGVRKIGWNDPANPAHQEWLDKLKARKTLFYNGGPTYGYAKVEEVPAGCTVLYGDQSAQARKAATGGGNTTTQLVQQVRATLDPITGFPIAHGQAQAVGANAGV
jgi:hypothetical protein